MFTTGIRPVFLLLIVFAAGFFTSCKKDQVLENPGSEEPDNTPNAGIMAYYDFSDDATDKSGNENHAKVVGSPSFVTGHGGQGLYLNEADELNECEQPGGEYLRLPAFNAVWAKGFTISAWVEFKENRSYERIFDMGNGLGETNGLNVTFSRLEDTDDLVLTSWVNSDPDYNRINGRLIAEGAIVNGEMQHYAATISPEGVMKIFVNGSKVAERADGNPVLDVYREKNYIGHSSYCYLDPDLKGIIDEVKIYNTVLTEKEIQDLYNL